MKLLKLELYVCRSLFWISISIHSMGLYLKKSLFLCTYFLYDGDEMLYFSKQVERI